jgi:hypothetical protein
MKRTAVIDKSFFQRICERPSSERRQIFSELQRRFRLVVPSALVDEVLINRGDPGRTNPRVVETMLRELGKLKSYWVDEEINWIYAELITGLSTKLKPASLEFFKNVCSGVSPKCPRYQDFISSRKALVKLGIGETVATQNQAAELFRSKPDEDWRQDDLGRYYCVVADAKEFYRIFICPGARVREENPCLWKETLGSMFEQMRQRFPHDVAAIDEALSLLTSKRVSECQVLWSTVVTRQFYFWAPLVKIRKASSKYILSRSEKSQFGNSMDQRYLAMSLLCDALITKDEDLAYAGKLFCDAGLWSGRVIRFPDGDICSRVRELEL